MTLHANSRHIGNRKPVNFLIELYIFEQNMVQSPGATKNLNSNFHYILSFTADH